MSPVLAGSGAGPDDCNWAFNPNLAAAPSGDALCPNPRIAARLVHLGDCGAGYLNPGMLAAPRLDPALADGWAAWIAHNQDYYRRYDLSITGFIIDGASPAMGRRA